LKIITGQAHLAFTVHTVNDSSNPGILMPYIHIYSIFFPHAVLAGRESCPVQVA